MAAFANGCAWLVDVTLSDVREVSALGIEALARQCRYLRYVGIDSRCERLVRERKQVETLFRAHAWAWARAHFLSGDDEE